MRFIRYVWLVSVLRYINFKFWKHVDTWVVFHFIFYLFFFFYLFKILDEEITPTMQKLQEVR